MATVERLLTMNRMLHDIFNLMARSSKTKRIAQLVERHSPVKQFPEAEAATKSFFTDFFYQNNYEMRHFLFDCRCHSGLFTFGAKGKGPGSWLALPPTPIQDRMDRTAWQNANVIYLLTIVPRIVGMRNEQNTGCRCAGKHLMRTTQAD